MPAAPVDSGGPAEPTPEQRFGAAGRAWRRLSRRDRLVAALAAALLLIGAGGVTVAYYVDSVPTPTQLDLPQVTTVYYADGKTPMARLGTQNRTMLTFNEMNDAVKQSIVAAEDQTFWTNPGIDVAGVLRAAWNNVTGGQTQGASTITQQYARLAADLKGVTYSRKMREAVIAWKLDRKYSKPQILEFYLNSVPFGRGAYGIEAAASAFFGKTANRNAPAAQQVTVAEAMLLVSMVKQPEPDPADPQGRPGYDPKRGPQALKNAQDRWNYVREGMVKLRYLTGAQADQLRYPDTVIDHNPEAFRSGLDRPTGVAVNHVLSELRQTDAFRNEPKDYIVNGGFQIVTTIDKQVQDAAEAAADIRRPTAPQSVQGQPANWQAALVAVEPGTGRVLAYYGGNQASGADYAGWYYDEDGEPHGFGAHPPGSSFKVYDLAEALRQKVSVKSYWDSPPTKEFPASGRTSGSPAGPIRNASSSACQPDCTLWQATVDSLNVPFFDLTEHLGAGKVLDMAARAGVDSMWAAPNGGANPVRVDLRDRSGKDVTSNFSTELGIGQYPITVLDHANGMATFAAGGMRAQAHFVTSVTRRGQQVYAAKPNQTDIGLNQEQINQLNWTLRKVEAAGLDNDWDSAGKTGTWQAGTSTTENAHVWMVGYTRALAAAVWLGTTDGKPLVTKTGSTEVYGASHAAPIWRQFMVAATEAMKLDKNQYRFGNPTFADDTSVPRVDTTQQEVPRQPTTPSRRPPTSTVPSAPAPSRIRPVPTPSTIRPSPPVTPSPTEAPQQ
ncbi:penicillin-binding protein [Planosporangium flavigriseum]|uniref:Penicillin-binding protein n=1 Tax=Planosporangium flavigriseum TaxID=373681 RepID=A0A8J3PLQ2_9ACTN|nr:transglycosylase domain-containing protein [Planosporangium flavigriseum]NJC66616.1 penicillin-binding protein [Planosporangium flavigriseum]GIG73489.1 penicillin-binding protein [Planosporangium flavigriseum]